jgi:hypothetical protein
MELELKKLIKKNKNKEENKYSKIPFFNFFLLIVNRKAHEGMVKRGSRG